MSTSFVQYKYCSLCRISYKKFRKHVHSQIHQKIVKNIVAKFLKKISDAKRLLDNPIAKDVNWSEAGKKIWCYFCACDMDLHLHQTTMVGDCILVSAGFLGHITRKDHSEKTAKFLKDNLIDMTRTPEFLLSNDIFLKFLAKGEQISVAFLNEKSATLQKAANVIKHQTHLRQHVVQQGLIEQNLKHQSRNVDSHTIVKETKDGKPSNYSTPGQADFERKKTIHAFGDGLTVMERLNEDDSLGNIHSNAVPPWLRPDKEEETDKNKIIGPSMIDWMKHKKLEQKRKLPACRVGAKFDHKTNQGDEWLPDFGGVWSRGPRTKAGQHFKKRQGSTLQRYDGQKNEITNNSNTALSSPGPSHYPSTLSHPPPKESNNTSFSFSSQNNFHHHTQSDNFTQKHFNHQPYHDQLPPPNTIDSPYVPNIQTQFGATHSLDLSTHSSKTVKPYISKRRKMGEPSCTNSSNPNFSLISSSETYSKHHFSFSSHPNFFQQSIPTSISNGNNNNLNVLDDNSTNHKTSSSFRLLATPVLRRK